MIPSTIYVKSHSELRSQHRPATLRPVLNFKFSTVVTGRNPIVIVEILTFRTDVPHPLLPPEFLARRSAGVDAGKYLVTNII